MEKLAEMFLNTFHREHILLKVKIKKLLRKIRSKNLTAGVVFFSSVHFDKFSALGKNDFINIIPYMPSVRLATRI